MNFTESVKISRIFGFIDLIYFINILIYIGFIEKGPFFTESQWLSYTY